MCTCTRAHLVSKRECIRTSINARARALISNRTPVQKCVHKTCTLARVRIQSSVPLSSNLPSIESHTTLPGLQKKKKQSQLIRNQPRSCRAKTKLSSLSVAQNAERRFRPFAGGYATGNREHSPPFSINTSAVHPEPERAHPKKDEKETKKNKKQKKTSFVITRQLKMTHGDFNEARRAGSRTSRAQRKRG